ncbi:MAG TPA: efflux RND transporter periplasmic adaptor subunit [Candidatus Limnocylindrales bacterium]|jgi:HlyD family secretion protein|nr:efflux RND transporter periplasmic adaptor subunit [Candidatus Limnocylindrales bacterium]
MKNWKKVALIAGAVVILLAIVGFTIQQSRKGVVTVQTGKVVREDLTSVVTASGEIKPKVYVNIGANAFGKITHLYVKEGDRVKQGQMLATLENVQSSADVSANQAALSAAVTDADAAKAAVNTATMDQNQAESEFERAKLDYDRSEALYKAQLIAKADYDTKKAAYGTATAQLGQAKAKLAQAKAQMDSAQRRIPQNAANLRRVTDVLSKTEYTAPFDGVITNLPVREGETVVIGIQNAPGSTLMTIADVSVITAEVKVDETDIVNVRLGETAEVSIDAIPKQRFKGIVTEIGNNAILRSTGVSTAQSTSSSQEAKDFKVVVTIQDPPSNLLPGLSTTARITTASRNSSLAIPIQALTIRQRSELEPEKKSKEAAVQAASLTKGNPKEELQGVFVLKNKKEAVFVPVTTGISGTTDIEVTNGLKEGDEIVTGSYKVLRTLRNGASVKVDNTTGSKKEES